MHRGGIDKPRATMVHAHGYTSLAAEPTLGACQRPFLIKRLYGMHGAVVGLGMLLRHASIDSAITFRRASQYSAITLWRADYSFVADCYDCTPSRQPYSYGDFRQETSTYFVASLFSCCYRCAFSCVVLSHANL